MATVQIVRAAVQGRRCRRLATLLAGSLLVAAAAWLVATATRHEALGSWNGDDADLRGLTVRLLISVSEPQFYAAASASACLLLGGLFAHLAHRSSSTWQGFVQACGTGIWTWVAGAGLAGVALGNLAWGWTLTGGVWQPLFVPLVSVAPAMVVLYGPGWRIAVTATVAGGLLTPPVSVLLVKYVCTPWDLPPVVGATGGMALAAAVTFSICPSLPWLPPPAAWRADRPTPAHPAADEPTRSASWIARRALADFSEAQFFGNEWASAAMLAGAVAAYAVTSSGVAYGSGHFVAVVTSQLLAAVAGVYVWRHRWRRCGFYPTFVPVVSVAPATVLALGGTAASVLLGGLAGALLAPPVAAGISARLPATFHPFVGNVISMSLCTALIVRLLTLAPGVSS
jgi:hypothetical protein